MKKHMSDIRKDVLPALLCTLSLSTLVAFGNVHANAQKRTNLNQTQKITKVSPIQKKSNESLNHGNINAENNINLKLQNKSNKVNNSINLQFNKNNQNKKRTTFSVRTPHNYHINKSNIRVRNFKFSGNGLQKARKTELKLGFKKNHRIHHIRQHHVNLVTFKPNVRKHITKATPISRHASEHSDKVNDYIHAKWFTDGLSKDEQHARNWIISHESGWHWRILSYGGRCIGLFQLDPAYLKRHGHVDLQHHHQVKVADKYVKNRYHTWKRAKAHWMALHWY